MVRDEEHAEHNNIKEVNDKALIQDYTARKGKSSPKYYVGIGASAGGLEALEKFFSVMAPDSGMTFMVVQHLSPDYKSLMVELLSKHTSMPVLRVEDGMEAEPDHVYLIPPKKSMSIFHGRLLLTDAETDHGLKLPIDLFLRSLAEDQGSSAVGIILSGTGSDGMRGIRAIKEAGGMVMVQDEDSAKFDGMPKSAISTGLADYILPAEDIPNELLHYAEHPYTRPHRPEKSMENNEDAIARILSALRKQAGVDFSYYKPNTVIRRIERRLSVNQLDSPDEYVNFLRHHPNETNTLFKELLIGVTSFFRDTEAFKILEEEIIPEVFSHASKDGVRLWTAGCSSGEEAYSLAILCQEFMERTGQFCDVKIFATDIDRDAIERAGNGIYPESIAADVSSQRLEKYFNRKGESYEVKRVIREMVIFATHNLTKDPPFTRLDFISCRNLLIYLQPELQRKLLSLFHFSLKTGAILFLGSSESVGEMTEEFESINSKWKMYRTRGKSKSSIMDTITLPQANERLNLTAGQGRAFEPSFNNAADDNMLQEMVTVIADENDTTVVVVDDRGQVVHIAGEPHPFFHISPGKMSLDIRKMAHKDLNIPLATSLRKAIQNRKPLTYNNLQIGSGEDAIMVRLKVMPIPQQRNSAAHTIITVRRLADKVEDRAPDENLDLDAEARQRITDLEQELNYTNENLQATIEELETSNEELQATNEELLASNEELQSTNEELQSVNEELYTVNAEYQSKIQELTELNNDLDNLLRSTGIGTLFLDDSLCIRKFTPAVTEVVKIMRQDIGRPLAHLTHILDYDSMIKDAKTVLEDDIPIEREVSASDNSFYILRILPYHTGERGAQGVVFTFIDITDLKASEQAREELSAIVETSIDAIISTRFDGTITTWNRGAEEIYGYTAKEMIGQNLSMLMSPEEYGVKIKRLREVEAGNAVGHHDSIHLDSKGNPRHVELSMSPVRNIRGEIIAASTIVRDHTALVEAQDTLKREQEIFASIMESTGKAITVVDRDGNIRYANMKAEKVLGITRDSITDRTFNAPEWSITRLDGSPMPEEELPFCKVINTGKAVRNIRHAICAPSGKTHKLTIDSAPIIGSDGEVAMVVNSIDIIEDGEGG